MRHTLLFIVFLLVMFSFGLQAKAGFKYPNPVAPGKISGTVIDSSNHQPVEFATISIFPQGNPKPVDGTVTDSKGSFKIQNLADGVYRVNITFIGYRAKNRTVTISGGNSVNLGRVLLTSNAVAIKGVSVTAQRDIIENRIDKMVFNAEKDITSQVGAATDVLRKVPQVSVDIDGNVELRGSTDVKVLINGKPSTIVATSLADALQSIPANQIKSIEVITSPSAKYDAEGTGGIINIILKKSTAKGVQGNINTSVGTRFENGTFNLSARKGTFGVNAGISGNTVLKTTSLTSSSQTTYDSIRRRSIIDQSGSGAVQRNGYNANFGIDWDISEKDNLGSTVRYNNFGFSSNGPSNQTAFFDPGVPVFIPGSGSNTNVDILSTTKFRVHGIDWNTDYKRVFNDRGRELDVTYQLSHNNNNNDYQNEQHIHKADSAFAGRRGYNLGSTTEQNITLDYTEPVTKTTKLELGSKVTLRDITSNSTADSLEKGGYQNRPQLTNDFSYHQKIYAGYALITLKPAKWLDLYGGLRIEHTDNTASFLIQPPLAVRSYNSFIPSITLSHTINQTSSIKVSYTERIQRPGLRDINPFVNAGNAAQISQGNPDLGPEHTQLAELGYNTFLGKGSNLNISVYYRYNTEDIQPYQRKVADTILNGTEYRKILYSQPLNIGIEHISGINLSGSVPVTPKLTLRGNVNLFYQNIVSNASPVQTNNSFNYRMNLNAAYNFTETLSGEFFGFLNSPRHTIQGSSPSFSIYNFGLRKQLWKKKGSIALTATSPFQQYLSFKSTTTGPNDITGQPSFQSNSERKIPIRQFGINFSYSFGKINYKNTKKSSGPRPSDNDQTQGGDDSGLGAIGGGGGGGAPSGGGQGARPQGGGGAAGQRSGTGKPGQNRPGVKKDSSQSKRGGDSSMRRDSNSTGMNPGSSPQTNGASDQNRPAQSVLRSDSSAVQPVQGLPSQAPVPTGTQAVQSSRPANTDTSSSAKPAAGGAIPAGSGSSQPATPGTPAAGKKP